MTFRLQDRVIYWRHLSSRTRAWLGPWSDLYWLSESRHKSAGQLAWASAQALAHRLSIPDRDRFAARYAAYARADETDVWALEQNADRWAKCVGPLPRDNQPYLAITAHYGAGMWAHVIFAQHHQRSRLLYQPIDQTAPFWEQQIGQRRLSSLHRKMGHPPLPTGGSAKAILAWWNHNGGIMALADAPPIGRKKIALQIFSDCIFYVPAGLFELAAQTQIPVYIYFCTLGHHGQRTIQISNPISSSNPHEIAYHFATQFGFMLSQDPAAWHFWPQLDVFINPTSSCQQSLDTNQHPIIHEQSTKEA